MEKKNVQKEWKGETTVEWSKIVQSILNSPEMEDMVEVGSIK